MKKILFSLMLLGVAIVSVAQDTIYEPKSIYYAPTWPGDLAWMDTTTFLMSDVGWQRHGDVLKLFYTKKELNVYGIAVVIITDGPYYDSPNKPTPRDSITVPDYDSCYEYIMLFEGDEYNWNLLRKTIVRETDTPACYMYAGLPYGYDEYDFNVNTLVMPKRVMECYFDEPAVVNDTFFIGMTTRTHDFYSTYTQSFYKYWPMSWMCLTEMGYQHRFEDESIYQQDTVTPLGEWIKHGSYGYTLLWPILTPKGYSGDYPPSGIEHHAALARMVHLAPNPAGKQATVLSSFGMEHISVVNATGITVLDQSADGYTHTIDVGSWPDGTYMVTVKTPMGTVTKQLVVAR